MPENRYRYKTKSGYIGLKINETIVAIEQDEFSFDKSHEEIISNRNNWDYTIKNKNIIIVDRDKSPLKSRNDNFEKSGTGYAEQNLNERPIFHGTDNQSLIIGDEFYLGYEDESQLDYFINKYNLLSLNEERGTAFETKFRHLSISQNKEVDFFDLVELTENEKWISSLEPNFTIIVSKNNETKPLNNKISQANLDLINVPQAWNRTKGDNNIIVAILDIGVRSTHESLKGKIVNGWNTFNNNNNTQPGNSESHGTACAGIIAGSHNAGKIKGIAPNCRIMPVKVAETSNSIPGDWVFTTESLKNGIIRAYENQASILNLSFWHPEHDVVSAAIDDAVTFGRPYTGGLSNGCLIIGAAGNEGKPNVNYPANLKPVIAVSATDTNGSFKVKPDWGSNYGQEIEISAPGELNYSIGSQNDSDYILFEGTSSAAAIVSGVAALVLSMQEDLSLSELKGILLNSPSTGIDDHKMGRGLINAERAVDSRTMT
ncbi:S8 family peptidase [Arcticibacterium luteifluviistationis]|uniref:Peptidase S8/S53 domain-containing protein n=1 Tax=Arcticibacterium luteifluviistationis TaxID=1784714 RepID=A0A2Z4GAF4_9BACT|nr:S8 family serine peptidase [Arcticibacterium luteifluviistationis]AWV97903.1 hypothetical protein DJ013_06870 [Arcticibacterium luteifluviistationis]